MINYSTEEWDYTPDFDYIHTRVTFACWSDMPDEIIRPAYAHLRPGGWFEAQETFSNIEYEDSDNPEEVAARSNNAFVRWVDEVKQLGGAVARPFDDACKLKEWLEEAGFVDVQERVYKIPLSGWPLEERTKRLGELWRANIEAGLGAFSYALFNRVQDRSLEEIEVSLPVPDKGGQSLVVKRIDHGPR